MSLVFFSSLLNFNTSIQTMCSSFTHNQTHVNHNYIALTQICDCISDFCRKYSCLVHNTIIQKYISVIKTPITYMQLCSLPLALRMKYLPSSYKNSYAHTTRCITLTIYRSSRVQRSWAREKKQLTTKMN